MKKTIIYITAIMLCVALAVVSGCAPAKTQTVTVGATTVTQWTSAVTQTLTNNVTSTVTLPGTPTTTTITEPPVTSTVTSPPVTSTVISPPVTTTVVTPPVTTTVTVTATPPATAAESISVSLLPLGGGFVLDIDGNSTIDQTFFVILKYKNNANTAFQNVKFNILFYSDLIDSEIAPSGFKVAAVGGTAPYFGYAGATTAGYSFVSTPGITVNANAESEIMLLVTIKLAAVTTKSAYAYPTVAII
jgi:hypothetical protein